MKTKYIFGTIFAALFMWGCEDKVKNWIEQKDDIPPGQLTGVAVENRHGGVMFTYGLPDDEDILGVKAVYRFREGGEQMEFYSSAYVDTLRLEGFPDTNKRIAELYVVDKSMNLSQPVLVEFEPLTPPIHLVAESMQFTPAFGGVAVQWENLYGANVAMDFYIEADGEWKLYESYFSSRKDGKVTFRGLEAVETNFRVEMRDRWFNYAEPLETTQTPLFEQYLPGKDPNISGRDGWLYKRYQWNISGTGNNIYRGDINSDRSNGAESGTYSWSQILDQEFGSANWFHTNDGGNNIVQFLTPGGFISTDLGPDVTNATAPLPVYFTIDISRSANISRVVWFNRYYATPLTAPFPIYFEVWGTNNKPKEPGEVGDGGYMDNWRYWTEWDFTNSTGEGFKGEGTWREDWTHLCTFELNLESGAKHSGDIMTQEEIDDLQNNGINVDVITESTTVPVQYIRFVMHEFSDRKTQMQIREIEFYGQYVD